MKRSCDDPRSLGRNPLPLLVLAPILGLALAAASPARAAEELGALWFTAQLHAPLTDRLSAHLLLQPRIGDDFSELARIVVRPWLQASFSHGLAGALGYDAHVIVEPRSLLEQRAWQQLSFRHSWAPTRANARFRLEQRFFEGSNEVALRARFLIGFAVPLSWSVELVARNEFFVNLNETGVIRRTGYRENRLFGGFARRLGGRTRGEVGYQMQWVGLPGSDLVNHTLMLGLAVDLPSLQDLWRSRSSRVHQRRFKGS